MNSFTFVSNDEILCVFKDISGIYLHIYSNNVDAYTSMQNMGGKRLIWSSKPIIDINNPDNILDFSPIPQKLAFDLYDEIYQVRAKEHKKQLGLDQNKD